MSDHQRSSSPNSISQQSENNDLYQLPEILHTSLAKECLNTAKTAKLSGNESNCSQNCERLFFECERLAEIATRKTQALIQRKKEYSQFQKDKKKFLQIQDGMKSLVDAQQELKQKNAEVAYLEVQLRKKEEEIRQLKEDKLNQFKEQDKSNQKYNGSIQTNLEFEKEFFKKFDKDIKSRLKFVGRIMDWQNFGDEISGRKSSDRTDPFEPDEDADHVPPHHFNLRKNELAKILENSYFPVIDAQEHDQLYRQEDFIIKAEFDKIIDTVLVELIALQDIVKKLGFKQNENHDGFSNSQILTEHQTMVISGLMKRLLNQIPVKLVGTNERTEDFQAKISNLYMLLQKRVFMKKVFEVTLDVNMNKAQDNIEICTQQILSSILDYEQFCLFQEEQAILSHRTPQRILDMFQDKIVEKMKALTDKKSSDSDNGFLSNKLKLMLSQRKHNDLGDGPTSEKLRTKKL